LLLPAVQNAREAARRISCKSNLKQLGIALHSYHETHRAFPPGYIAGGPDPTDHSNYFGWASMLLPYVDQQTLYSKLDFNVDIDEGVNAGLVRTTLAIFRCPTDVYKETITSAHSVVTYGVSNYPGVSGQVACEQTGGGMFGLNTRTRMRDITDGSSQTFAVGERVGNQAPIPDRAPVWAGVYITETTNNVEVVVGWTQIPLNRKAWSEHGFNSFHPGGAHFLMGDGAVRFVSSSIDSGALDSTTQLIAIPGVYQYLSTIAGGEVVGEF